MNTAIRIILMLIIIIGAVGMDVDVWEHFKDHTFKAVMICIIITCSMGKLIIDQLDVIFEVE